jgi:hypothetical protein
MANGAFRSVTVLSIAVLLSALLAAPALAQNVEDGQAAAQQGDPATAIAIWTPLAEAGDRKRNTGWPNPIGAAGGACPKTSSDGRSGTCAPPSRVMPRPSSSWVGCTSWGIISRRTITQPLSGTPAPPKPETRTASMRLPIFIRKAAACRKIWNQAHVLWESATMQGHEAARLELCERSGRFCHTCVADPQTFEIRQLRGSDPMSFLEEQAVMNASWAWDDEIIIEGRTYRKSGLPQVRTADVLEFFAFKDKVPFMIDSGDGPKPNVIYALHKGLHCEVQPYHVVF